jgi:hypothetical protein
MAISRSQLVKELEPGLNALFGLEYKNYANEHAEIFSSENSDRAFEEEVMLSGFGNASVKPEGQSVNYDAAQETFTARYTHETLALAFSITEEAIEDNLYDRLASRYTKALARSMANSKQVKAANVLNRAFNSSFTGGDGLELCSTAHVIVSGTEQIAAKGMKMIIPSALQFTAERLMKSVGRVGTADNDINAVKNMGMIPQGYVVNHYLTDTDAFFIKTDVPNGLKHFTRAPIKTAMEGDFETGNVRYKARERYSFGWSDWRGIFGSPGA